MASSSPTILISGCSSGIGYCVAHGLRAKGWRVLASARRPEDVARLQDEGFAACLLDIADAESIAAAVAWAWEQSDGRIDALFNNAGFGVPGAVEDLSRAALRHQFETNVFGSIELTNALLPLFRQQGRGRLLFNSSVLGFAAMPFRGAYNASKFALEGFVDTLRLELHGSGIHAVLIEPGPIVSRFRANAAAQFARWLPDAASSRHAASYAQMQQRLKTPGVTSRLTLPPEAVLAAVEKALTARRPAIRYRVTLPTIVFWYAKRLLPSRWCDALLRRAGA